MILDGLNESQQRAVITIEGPLIIIAGPGTGKTLTITRRIAYLIHKGIEPENIFALTFTNRAAIEMKERTKIFLGSKVEKVFVGTFHHLGLKIMQDTLPTNFTILNREEQTKLLKNLVKGTTLKIQQLSEKISKIKNFIIEIDEEIKDIYGKYQSALQKNSFFDLDDLILKPIEILRSDYPINRYIKKNQFIIVDEYQDINPAQYKLLKFLARDSFNLCVIGDSDQAIYAFRGADITNFLNFEKDFQHAKRIFLQKNYRSTSTILKASSALIKNNLKRIDKEVISTRDKGSPITLISVPDDKSEGEIIVKEIEYRMGGTSHYQLLDKHIMRSFSTSYGFSDFAVIFRTNAQARILEESFKKSGIPFQIVGKQRFSIEEILRILKKEAENIGNKFCFNDYFEVVLKELGKAKNIEDNEIRFLQDIASKYQQIKIPESINNFINEISLFSPADGYNPKADAVTLMTLHMAKGLEFKIVFITGVEEGLIPFGMKGDIADLEEERRLFYVGMTRAKDEIYLLHARRRFLYGQTLALPLSSFVEEIPERFINRRFIPDRFKKLNKQGALFDL